MNQNMLLSLLALAVTNMAFLMAVIHYWFQPQWIAAYIAVVLLYLALYFRRSSNLPRGLRRRLGKAAVTLGAVLSALFFYSCAPGMSSWVVGAAWLGCATTAYFAYGVVIFDDGDDAE